MGKVTAESSVSMGCTGAGRQGAPPRWAGPWRLAEASPSSWTGLVCLRLLAVGWRRPPIAPCPAGGCQPKCGTNPEGRR
eukprot:3692735-Prorocentrum_lima.AAC.1